MDILSTIQQLSKQEKKTLLERMVKLQEEAGELANEVLISQKASGSERKKKSKKGDQERSDRRRPRRPFDLLLSRGDPCRS